MPIAVGTGWVAVSILTYTVGLRHNGAAPGRSVESPEA
jgi:hypothetical protein